MRITESQLRQIIREELGRQRDEDDPEEERQEPEPDRAAQPSAFIKQFVSHFGGAEDQGNTFSISKRKRSNIRI